MKILKINFWKINCLQGESIRKCLRNFCFWNICFFSVFGCLYFGWRGGRISASISGLYYQTRSRLRLFCAVLYFLNQGVMSINLAPKNNLTNQPSCFGSNIFELFFLCLTHSISLSLSLSLSLWLFFLSWSFPFSFSLSLFWRV